MESLADAGRRSSPLLSSMTSVLKPFLSPQRRYMRSSICAQSCASVPPAPAWMSRKAPRGSISPGNMRESSSLRTRSSSFVVSLTISENPASSLSASTSVRSSAASERPLPSWSSSVMVDSSRARSRPSVCAFSGAFQTAGSASS